MEIIGIKDYEDFLDKKIQVLLYEGRYIEGFFRSFDQFNNLTLEDCFIDDKEYGLYIIRGENVIFLGIPEDLEK